MVKKGAKAKSKKRIKKQKQAQQKLSWLYGIPIGFCILFICICVGMGSVFIFSSWYIDAPIERDEAISLNVTFDSYRVNYYYKSHDEIILEFKDYEELWVAHPLYEDMENALEALSSGDNLHLLVHPRSMEIWEIGCGGKTLLSFEDTKNTTYIDSIGFTVIAVVAYVIAVFLSASLILRLIAKRKERAEVKKI